MNTPKNVQNAYLSMYMEQSASEHPDIKGQTEFQKKAAEIIANRKKRREEANDPNVKRAKKAAEFFSKSVIRKEGLEVFEEKDHEHSMARSEIHSILRDAKKLKSKLGRGEGNIEAWVQSKITRAADYLNAASNYLESGEHSSSVNEESMTAADIKKENALKAKYDKSGMKSSMISQYGPEKGKSIYFATIRKQAMKESLRNLNPELIDEAKLSRTEKRRIRQEKQKGKSKGAVHAFDVDETLFSHGKKGKPNVKVHVKDKSGNVVKSLSNQEFNTHKLEPGHSYDFGEFRSAKKFAQTASPNKKVIKKLKRLQRKGKNVHLVTARDKFDDPEQFRKHFSRHGMNIPSGNIHYTGGMKGGDIGQKKVAVAKGIAKMGRAKSIHMYDDAAKVHKAFEGEKKKSSQTKIKTHLVQPNKRGEVMSRSYQATKSEEFELWVNALIYEGYDLSDFTVDELIEAYVGLLNEASTAVAAPAGEPGKKRPIKKGSKPIEYKSPYKNIKKEYPKEETEVPPYEYWKSFIKEDVIESDVVTEDVEVEVESEKKMTSYDFWKSYITEKK